MDFWILGAGKFGSIAVERIREKYPQDTIKVVDSNQQVLDALGSGVETHCMSGLDFLVNGLEPEAGPDWIVPAIPVHVAYEWLLARLGKDKAARALDVPKDVAYQVPNPLWGKHGELYASQADFLCPDNCPEPENRCFKTKLPRENLFDLLKFVQVKDFSVVVIRSHQLTPGVGGVTPEALFQADKEIGKTGGSVLICTACRCHGVIHGILSQ